MDLWVVALLVGAVGGLAALAGVHFGRQRAGQAVPLIPVEFVAARVPVAILLFADDGLIRYANPSAIELLFAGVDPVGRNFLRLLDTAPAEVCRALTGATDALFSLDEEGVQQTFQLLRRETSFHGEKHTLLMLNPLTREVARHEAEILKKVIRVINHELNNSLASMSSLVSSGRFIIEHPEKLPHLARVLNGIDERTGHLQRFLNEYAQLSRLPGPRPAKVDWEGLLRRLQGMFPDAQIGEPSANAGELDETLIEQAIINLLKNANEAGGPKRQVRLVFRAAEDALEIGVLDRGSGFSHEALKQGLLPFYSTKEGGSGVGLALCREVAEGHGGSLRIKNREGGGSAVYMVLPISEPGRALHKTVALTLTRT